MGAINSWYKRHFLGIDALIALVLAVMVLTFAYTTEIGLNAHKHVEQNLLVLYRTTATISGSLMGLSMAVAVLAIDFWQGKWFDLIKQSDKSTHEIWETLKQSTWCLGILTVTSLFAIAAGGGNIPVQWTIIPYLMMLSLTLARLTRAVIIIHRMLDIAVQASRNN